FLIAWDHWLSGSLSCPLCIKRGATDVRRNCWTCFKGHLLMRRGERLRHPDGRDLLRWWHGGTCRHKCLGRDGCWDIVHGWQHARRKPDASEVICYHVMT